MSPSRHTSRASLASRTCSFRCALQSPDRPLPTPNPCSSHGDADIVRPARAHLPRLRAARGRTSTFFPHIERGVVVSVALAI